MKAKVFILTFMTYASVHMMRMSYSFNKHNIETKFGVGDLFLGMLDALIFFSLSIGTLLRYSILNDNNSILICLKTAIPTSLAFSLIPIISLFKEQNASEPANEGTYSILLIGLGLFGFCQFSFFPALITIFSHYFNVKEEGTLVGIWSSKSNVGNVIGFFLSNFLVFQLNIKWEVTMILCSIIHISVALLLYWLVDAKQHSEQSITTEQLFNFIKRSWDRLQFRLYILSFSFFKAILYSYELWTPQFLVDVGFERFAGYVPMVFDISTLVGSVLMGKLYEDFESQKGEINVISLIKSYKFTISSLFILLATILYLLVPPNIIVYFFLAVFMGMFLGGVYNSLQNSEILSYAKNDPRETDLLSTVNIGLGCFLVGIFQFVIGLVIHLGQKRKEGIVRKHNHSHTHGLIYFVIAVLALVALILTYVRTRHLENQHKEVNQQKQVNEKEINPAKEKMVKEENTFGTN